MSQKPTQVISTNAPVEDGSSADASTRPHAGVARTRKQLPFLRCLALIGVTLLSLVGCKDEKAAEPAAAKTAAPSQPSTDSAATTSPTTPKAKAEPSPAGGAADPAKVDRAAKLSTRIMIGVAAAAKGAKSDCARMTQTVRAAMTAAEQLRIELLELRRDAAVKAALKAGLDAGKYPDLKKDLRDAMDSAVVCPDAFNQVDRVIGEII